MVIYEAEDRDDEGAKIHKKTSAASGAIGSTPSIRGLLCCSSPQRNLHTRLATQYKAKFSRISSVENSVNRGNPPLTMPPRKGRSVLPYIFTLEYKEVTW